jgi:hypothetical protein
MAKGAAMSSTRHIYIAQTQPGFEAIAATEIAQRLDGADILDARSVSDKNGMLRFAYSGDPRDPLTLRTVEDVFVVAAEAYDLAPDCAALRRLEQPASSAPSAWRVWSIRGAAAKDGSTTAWLRGRSGARPTVASMRRSPLNAGSQRARIIAGGSAPMAGSKSG